MSKKISALSAGSLVKLNENGVAKKYIMLGYNHYGKAEVTLLPQGCRRLPRLQRLPERLQCV